MDEDFIFYDLCNCYKSNKEILFAPFGKKREIVFLKFKNSEELELFYYQNNDKKIQHYKLTYVDSVDLKTHRNVYFAEDGFELFNE